MTDRVIFHMWGPFRESLIESHRFFVAEAKKRLLEQFSEAEMQADAERYGNEWLARKASRFDPDRDDEGSVYEQANDENVNHYLRLEELRDTTRLSIIASMYHEWEKQLRHWVAKEMGHFIRGKNTQQVIWQQPVERLFDFLQACKWPIRSKAYYHNLCRCQLVVNVYKHGAGTSFDALKDKAPEFVRRHTNVPAYFFLEPDYTDLNVSDADLEDFSAAIISFWGDVPENILRSQIEDEPDWFRKALRKDVEANTNTNPV
jgi:hypothetical protein